MNKYALLFIMLLCLSNASAKKKVYMTYILHGNMNYDRYTRPTIWTKFPVIYDNLLTFMDEHRDFKGQLQFSGQTYGSLQQAAPQVIKHARSIQQRKQINFTGTFYSEPVNVNMDGETNYRCAWLGTRIIEDNIGFTDGFYLQERAYHPQLPWILKNANVSWTPIITNAENYFPFRLKGLDGSYSVCVPITRGDFIDPIKQAPKNALITIEEDYEYPQTFTSAYEKIQKFNKEQKDIEVEWITVKDYINKFGVNEEHYVDHTAKASHPRNGTYSRWTADPLDIILQEATNKAMSTFRVANAIDALAQSLYKKTLDQDFSNSGIILHHDPLTWNIESADLYPDFEKYLFRNGKTTVLSKAEHLLLWAVNSDAKGWYPLYEKRRERLNSLENSTRLSESIIRRGLQMLGEEMRLQNYDRYFIAANMEKQRNAEIKLSVNDMYEFYNLNTGKKLPSTCINEGNQCTAIVEASLPEYGYTVIAARKAKVPTTIQWRQGNEIHNQGMSLKASGTDVSWQCNGQSIQISLDTFQLKALASMDLGKGDGEWRSCKPYGTPRISICTNGLYPQLRIEHQIDWLIHLQQIFTLKDDRLMVDLHYNFPHPTIVRQNGKLSKDVDFNPQGLDLIIKTQKKCHVGYDIPFGISEFHKEGVNYFCPLSSAFIQYPDGGGLLASPQTGEQALAINSDNGEITLFLGASTTSGPIREMGLTMKTPTTAEHDLEWYAEPFHGEYHHSIMLYSYRKSWQEEHIPNIIRNQRERVYVEEIFPAPKTAGIETEQSIIKGLAPNVEITSINFKDGKLSYRLNEREGTATTTTFRIGAQQNKEVIHPFGISGNESRQPKK